MKKRGGRRPPPQSRPAPAPAIPAWWAPLALISSWLAPAALVAAGLVVYSNTFGGVFLFDDLGTIVRNTSIRSLSNLSQVLLPPADTAVAGRPLVNLSFAINYAIGGTSVWGYHAVNLALHIASALLIFALIRRVAGLSLAFATALIWTVHPLNSEVVNYLTERTESMMAVCFLFTMHAAARNWRVAAVAVCALGMLCKETMAVAPIAVILFDWAYGLGRGSHGEGGRWKFYAALAATWIVPAVMLATRGQTLSSGFATANVSAWTYFLNQPAMILQYLRLSVWPSGLVLYYGWPQPLTFAAVWPAMALVAALVVASVIALMKWRRIGALAVWVFLVLGPTSSFLPIATEVGAERRMYLPLIGLIVLALVGLAALVRRLAPAPGSSLGAMPAAIVAIVTIVLGATTYARNADYTSALGMADTVLKHWPTANAHQLVGTELLIAGRAEEALPHLRIAAESYPPARYFLGQALFSANQRAEAIVELERFTREEPALAPVAARLLIAKAYGSSGQMPQAIEHLKRVLAAEPGHIEAHGLLAEALVSERAYVDAIPHYQAYLTVENRNVNAWTKLGVLLGSIGRLPEARAAFERALAIDPTYAPAIEAMKQLVR